jgi:hypothetical protein
MSIRIQQNNPIRADPNRIHNTAFDCRTDSKMCRIFIELVFVRDVEKGIRIQLNNVQVRIQPKPDPDLEMNITKIEKITYPRLLDPS